MDFRHMKDCIDAAEAAYIAYKNRKADLSTVAVEGLATEFRLRCQNLVQDVTSKTWYWNSNNIPRDTVEPERTALLGTLRDIMAVLDFALKKGIYDSSMQKDAWELAYKKADDKHDSLVIAKAHDVDASQVEFGPKVDSKDADSDEDFIDVSKKVKRSKKKSVLHPGMPIPNSGILSDIIVEKIDQTESFPPTSVETNMVYVPGIWGRVYKGKAIGVKEFQKLTSEEQKKVTFAEREPAKFLTLSGADRITLSTLLAEGYITHKTFERNFEKAPVRIGKDDQKLSSFSEEELLSKHKWTPENISACAFHHWVAQTQKLLRDNKGVMKRNLVTQLFSQVWGVPVAHDVRVEAARRIFGFYRADLKSETVGFNKAIYMHRLALLSVWRGGEEKTVMIERCKKTLHAVWAKSANMIIAEFNNLYPEKIKPKKPSPFKVVATDASKKIAEQSSAALDAVIAKTRKGWKVVDEKRSFYSLLGWEDTKAAVLDSCQKGYKTVKEKVHAFVRPGGGLVSHIKSIFVGTDPDDEDDTTPYWREWTYRVFAPFKYMKNKTSSAWSWFKSLLQVRVDSADIDIEG